MVCLGNICRSPVAEGILRKKALENNLSITIDSAGTSGWHDGEQPDTRSIKNALKNEVDISQQKSRKVVPADFDLFDKIYAMDESNYNNLILSCPSKHQNKIKMILNESHPKKNLSVPDPYYTIDGFDEVFELLNEACDVIVKKIQQKMLK